MDCHHKSIRLTRCVSSACWGLIGEDIWIEIFKKLPIESLCCSLCVCKGWRSLISSQSFIKLHHSLTCSTTPPKLKPYLRVNIVDECHDSLALYRPTGGDHIRHDVHFPFRFSDDPPLHSFTFVDSIKGVVCFSYSMGSSFDSTILWNPAIHKYVSLPQLPFPFDLETGSAGLTPRVFNSEVHYARFGCSAIGLGYDRYQNEFKVVRVWIPSYHMSSRCRPSCEVYSAREGLWRRVSMADMNLQPWEFYSQRATRRSCFVNGALYWLISTRDGTLHSVLMFDCEREVFRTMDLPQEIYVKEEGVTTKHPIILEYGGMLAVVLHSAWGLWGVDWAIEMWVMEEHGGVSTWKKLYRVVDNYTSDCFDVKSYQGSLEKMAPYGPNQWDKLRSIGQRYYQVMNDHVHEESMFLLDDIKAVSYIKEKIVHISIPMEFKKQYTAIPQGRRVDKK